MDASWIRAIRPGAGTDAAEANHRRYQAAFSGAFGERRVAGAMDLRIRGS